MITLNNLTEAQVEMLDFMWNELETEEDFTNWYDALDKEDQDQADLLMRLVILETFEEQLDDLTQAKMVLSKFAIH